jgi:RHS repeat-associated protein
MIDEVGIIHMNGRIYDAKLGRFMQADPIIQDPTSIASLNRYSYCANNPLNATDPSGFSFLSKAWKQLRPFIGAIVAIVMTCVMPAAVGFWAQLAQASLIGAVSGAVGAAANGGNILKGAFYGAFSAAAGVVGGPLGGALAAGAIADREGGSFGRAFLAAAIGGAGGSGSQPSFTGLLQSAVLGGVATRITGGKFKNGAASAAFMYAVQAGMSEGLAKQSQACEPGSNEDLNVASAIDKAKEMTKKSLDMLSQAKAGDAASLKYFEEYFGKATEENLAIVTKKFQKIDKRLAKAVKWDFSGKDEFARVNTFGGSTVHLGTRFTTAPLIGFNSQAGTFIHELSHWAGTTDYAYGVGAKGLEPAKAIRNADNYEYFAEGLK